MKNLNKRIGFGRGLKKEYAGEAVWGASRLYSGNAKFARVWVGKSAAADVGSGVEDSGPSLDSSECKSSGHYDGDLEGVWEPAVKRQMIP